MLTNHVRNILAVYYQASEYDRQTGMDWYDRAYIIAENLAILYNIEVRQAAGVIAAISPRVSWSRNVILAEQLISGYKKSLPVEMYTKGIMADGCGKAHQILKGNAPVSTILKGNKVRAFYICILTPEMTEAVCVDTHAISIALGFRCKDKDTAKIFKSEKLYNEIAEAYRNAAVVAGIRPHQMQAVTWVTWRRLQLGIVD